MFGGLRTRAILRPPLRKILMEEITADVAPGKPCVTLADALARGHAERERMVSSVHRTFTTPNFTRRTAAGPQMHDRRMGTFDIEQRPG